MIHAPGKLIRRMLVPLALLSTSAWGMPYNLQLDLSAVDASKLQLSAANTFDVRLIFMFGHDPSGVGSSVQIDNVAAKNGISSPYIDPPGLIDFEGGGLGGFVGGIVTECEPPGVACATSFPGHREFSEVPLTIYNQPGSFDPPPTSQQRLLGMTSGPSNSQVSAAYIDLPIAGAGFAAQTLEFDFQVTGSIQNEADCLQSSITCHWYVPPFAIGLVSPFDIDVGLLLDPLDVGDLREEAEHSFGDGVFLYSDGISYFGSDAQGEAFNNWTPIVAPYASLRDIPEPGSIALVVPGILMLLFGFGRSRQVMGG